MISCAGSNNITDLVTLLIALLAFVLSFVEFCRNAARQKKEATLNAYSELQSNALSKLVMIPGELVMPEYLSPDWNELTLCLAALEHYSVGINTGIYSLDVVNRVGGSFFIHQYEQLKQIINEKSKRDVVKGKHYDEFEKAAALLNKYRNETCAARRLYMELFRK